METGLLRIKLKVTAEAVPASFAPRPNFWRPGGVQGQWGGVAVLKCTMERWGGGGLCRTERTFLVFFWRTPPNRLRPGRLSKLPTAKTASSWLIIVSPLSDSLWLLSHELTVILVSFLAFTEATNETVSNPPVVWLLSAHVTLALLGHFQAFTLTFTLSFPSDAAKRSTVQAYAL